MYSNVGEYPVCVSPLTYTLIFIYCIANRHGTSTYRRSQEVKHLLKHLATCWYHHHFGATVLNSSTLQRRAHTLYKVMMVEVPSWEFPAVLFNILLLPIVLMVKLMQTAIN